MPDEVEQPQENGDRQLLFLEQAAEVLAQNVLKLHSSSLDTDRLAMVTDLRHEMAVRLISLSE